MTEQELIELYKKAPASKRNKPVYVEKYKIEKQKELSEEEKLINIFGEGVRIEE